MSSRINWAFIGCGNVVKYKSGGAFNIPGISSIEAVFSRNERNAKSVSSMFQATNYFTSVEELLSDNSINAVYIATPPGSHLKNALSCCRANKPVYIEKPLARNLTEANTIVNSFKESHIPIYVAHYYRAQPKFKFIKDQIQKNVIGIPEVVHFCLERYYEPLPWHYKPEISGGGRFFDIAPHSLDIIQNLFGKFFDIHGNACNYNSKYQVEDVVMMTFMTESGVACSANYFLNSNCKQDKMVIIGSKGKMSFSVHDNSNVIIENSDGLKTYSFVAPTWEEQYMIKEVTDALKGKKNLAVSGEESLNIIAAMDIALCEFYHGRNDNFWERPNTWG